MAHAGLWRTSHDTARAPEVILLGHAEGGGTYYSVLDAHSGNQTASGTLPYSVTQVGPLTPSPVHTSRAWPWCRAVLGKALTGCLLVNLHVTGHTKGS